MKTIYLNTLDKLGELPTIQYADRDRGQIDKYEGKPAVKFPCCLISVSLPKRKNLDTHTQLCNVTVTLRFAFERLNDASNIASETRRAQAVKYYDTVEAAETLFQGWNCGGKTSPLECTATVDEQRPDMDIVRFTFTGTYVKDI
ncbi:hypothetical protein FW774_17270 [Pedobacter sp. BS3]|uniref:hypothetical protein n=1 Tax=Pedobacter sp. BS3 TaxID=2567937 RepID=UPI0011EF2406|nr:hypothetical protein [Pedobacter sp. BS3]TZF81807.1 hypothetical protein FW774_17270 [Pedobacter sp. BS3]